MLDVAIGVFLFLAGFWLRGQLVGLKWKSKQIKPEPVRREHLKPPHIKRINPSTPI